MAQPKLVTVDPRAVFVAGVWSLVPAFWLLHELLKVFPEIVVKHRTIDLTVMVLSFGIIVVATNFFFYQPAKNLLHCLDRSKASTRSQSADSSEKPLSYELKLAQIQQNTTAKRSAMRAQYQVSSRKGVERFQESRAKGKRIIVEGFAFRYGRSKEHFEGGPWYRN
jgi:hypothetical protein